MLAQGGQLRPACHECHVASRIRQPGTKVTTDATGSHDRDTQGHLLLWLNFNVSALSCTLCNNAYI